MAAFLEPFVPFVTPFATALVLSVVLVPACRRLGLRYGFVAHPVGDRWHGRPVPLLGGAAIFAAVVLGLVVLRQMPPRPVLFGGAAVMFLLGLIDDRRALNATSKLVVQFVVATVFVFFGEGLNWTGSPTADAALTVIWVVGVTNAFNLIDNMDGLCAGVTFICGAFWLVILLTSDAGVAALADARYLCLLLGAVAGFLVYNRHPASVFMGDAGTLFLGASMAGLTLGMGGGAPGGSSGLAVVAAPLLVLAVPLLDMALVTGTRFLGARSVVSGGRDHSSHRLVAIGLSEGRAVAVLCGIAALAGGVGWAVTALDQSWSILITAAAVISVSILGAYLAQVDVAGAFEARHGRRMRQAPSSCGSGPYAGLGRSAEVLLDFFLITVAYYATYRLRFEGPAFQENFGRFLNSLPIVMACQLVALRVFGAYRTTWWRFGLMEAVALARAVAGGTVAALLVILYAYRFNWYSRTVFVIDGVLLLVALVATRLSFRLIGEFVDRNRNDGERLVFYGAGESDQAVVREFLRTSRTRYDVLGFVAEDSGGHWRRALGYPFLGDQRRLLELVRDGEVDVVMVGAEKAARGGIDQLRDACEAGDVQLFSVGLALTDLRRAADDETSRARFLAGC